MDLTNVINGLKKQEKFYSDRIKIEEDIWQETLYNKKEHEALKYAIKILSQTSRF